jgi:Meiotically up-regulated gene 113
MEKPRSQADVSGYIYTFEIRGKSSPLSRSTSQGLFNMSSDPNTPKKVHLKVGRAVNLVKRIDQWGKQCGSKEQVLRGWWPGAVEDDDGDAAANGSLMKGRVKAGEKGPLCHRLERLVHLELADLAVNAPYLDPDFPKPKDAGDRSGTSTPSKKPPGSPAGKKLLDKPCPDCTSLGNILSFNLLLTCTFHPFQVVPSTKRYSL